MSTESRLLPVVAITGGSILVGCGGYSGSSCGSYGSYGSYGSFAAAASRTRTARSSRNGKGANMTPASGDFAGATCGPGGNGAAGIYEGTLTDTASRQETPVVAIIAENGDGAISGQEGVYYRLSVGTWGYDVSGSFAGYSQGTNFPNGTHATSGSVSSSVTTAGLSGSLTDQTGDVATLSLNFDGAYDHPSALPTLAGSWSYSSGGFSLTATIQSDGTFSATDSNSCSYIGVFGIIDPSFNAYNESFVRSCNGVSMPFTGLASYFPATNGAAAHIELLADDHAGDYLAADLQ
jgi:hypothetical protein